MRGVRDFTAGLGRPALTNLGRRKPREAVSVFYGESGVGSCGGAGGRLEL